MLNIDEIRQLIKLIDESSINEFTYENEGSKVELKKQSGTVQTIQQVGCGACSGTGSGSSGQASACSGCACKRRSGKRRRKLPQDHLSDGWNVLCIFFA